LLVSVFVPPPLLDGHLTTPLRFNAAATSNGELFP
jgi:hypothetical protein